MTSQAPTPYHGAGTGGIGGEDPAVVEDVDHNEIAIPPPVLDLMRGVNRADSALSVLTSGQQPHDLGSIPPSPTQGQQLRPLLTPSASATSGLVTVGSSTRTITQNPTPYDTTPVSLAPVVVGSSSLTPATSAISASSSPAPPAPVSPLAVVHLAPAPPPSTNPAIAMPLLDPTAVQGVALGVQQLERQQEELELRRSRSTRSTVQIDAGATSTILDSSRSAQRYDNLVGQGHVAYPFIEVSHSNRDHPQHVSGDDDTEPSTVSGIQGGHGSSVGDGMGSLNDDAEGRNTGHRPSSTLSRFLRTPLKIRHGLSLDRSSHGGAEQDPAKELHTGGHRGAGENIQIDSNVNIIMTHDANKNVDDLHDDDDDMWGNDEVKPIVFGYLQKLGRNGNWQRRFFETDGECLTYYKSKKRSKILATLDLCKVGKISVDSGDPTGCTFTIQVADRPYFLRAENKATCSDWVISLNRVKEARLQVGGFKLVQPQYRTYENSHQDSMEATAKEEADRKRSESGEDAVVVVVSANRRRTKAITADLDTDDSAFHQMLIGSTNGVESPTNSAAVADSADVARIVSTENLSPRPFAVPTALSSQPSAAAQGQNMVGLQRTSPTGSASSAPPSYGRTLEQISQNYASPNIQHRSPRLIAQLPPVVLARWQKRRTNFQKLSMRLARWARRMRMLRCTARESDVVGPPRFQYNERSAKTTDTQNRGPVGGDGLYHGTTSGHTGSIDRSGGPSAWIGKEQQLQLRARGRVMSDVDEHFSSVSGRGEGGSEIEDNFLTVPSMSGGVAGGSSSGSSGGVDLLQSSSSISSRRKSVEMKSEFDKDFSTSNIVDVGVSTENVAVSGTAQEIESREIA